MHECPNCCQDCDCDGEDMWRDAPIDCDHECEWDFEGDDSIGFEDEFYDGVIDDNDQEEDELDEDFVFSLNFGEDGSMTIDHNLAFTPELSILKGLGMPREEVTKDMVYLVMQYASIVNKSYVSFSQTFKELYEDAREFKKAMLDADYSDEEYSDNQEEVEYFEPGDEESDEPDV